MFACYPDKRHPEGPDDGLEGPTCRDSPTRRHTPKGVVATTLSIHRLNFATSASIAMAASLLSAAGAEAQVYSSQQATPQSYAAAPCVCPFPQGYCAFPQGYCPPPAGPCGPVMSSQQGSAQAPMMPPYSYQGFAPKPYPAPTPYMPRPLGIPTESMPSMQGTTYPNPQVASRKK